jgi:phytoene synthase
LPAEGAAYLDELIGRVDPDRWLTTRFISDQGDRADVLALYAFDHELARARRAATTPLLAEIRLTWWREALEEIGAGQPVRRHPVVEALAGLLVRRPDALPGLVTIIDGYVAALEPVAMDEAAALAWADATQGTAARIAVTILDPASDMDAAASAGRAWGLALLQRAELASRATIAAPLRAALDQARRDARRLSVAALPAALPARVARFDLAGRTPGRLSKQLALVLAATTGRL